MRQHTGQGYIDKAQLKGVRLNTWGMINKKSEFNMTVGDTDRRY